MGDILVTLSSGWSALQHGADKFDKAGGPNRLLGSALKSGTKGAAHWHLPVDHLLGPSFRDGVTTPPAMRWCAHEQTCMLSREMLLNARVCKLEINHALVQ